MRGPGRCPGDVKASIMPFKLAISVGGGMTRAFRSEEDQPQKWRQPK
jgi:hypothetical protein